MNSLTAIRKGDRVRFKLPVFTGGSFYRGKSKGAKFQGYQEYSGIVERHSYGEKTNQHTFSIRLDSGELKLVKGRNLYPNLLEHVPDPNSEDRINEEFRGH